MKEPSALMLQAPGDARIRHGELEGFSPVSRIGETVTNAFIDSYEFGALPDVVTKGEIFPGADNGGDTYESKPHFHLYASVLPGMLTVSRKARNNVFRNYVASETAIPVISCASCLGPDDEGSFFFSGVARSKSVLAPDSGEGPTIDECVPAPLHPPVRCPPRRPVAPLRPRVTRARPLHSQILHCRPGGPSHNSQLVGRGGCPVPAPPLPPPCPHPSRS